MALSPAGLRGGPAMVSTAFSMLRVSLYKNPTQNYLSSTVLVTSQGESVPRRMGIQYSRTNILGDMSKYMNNSDSFI